MRRKFAFLFGLFALTTVAVAAGPAVGAVTGRVSVSSAQEQGNSSSFSFGAGVSADGRFAIFESQASNLVADDTNSVRDVFLRDRGQGVTELVSVSSTGAQGNDSSFAESLSNNGRFVVFDSYASNLVPGDTNGTTDVFVRDRATGTTERVSVASTGGGGNGDSVEGVISADGRLVAFESEASNLVPDDTNHDSDIFVHNRVTHRTRRVSVSTAGKQANGYNYDPVISADGRIVVFESGAQNLVNHDANRGFEDIFARNLISHRTSLVSVSSDGEQGSDQSGGYGFAVSADGRIVAFASLAPNLVSHDTNDWYDVFVRNRATGRTRRVSVTSAGAQVDALSIWPTLSADGRLVAFTSLAPHLVPGDTNNHADIFLHNRTAGTTRMVSLSSSGIQGNNGSNYPVMSADGRVIAFTSLASNLVPGDTNRTYDVFVRVRH